MMHTKFHSHRPFGSREEDFLRFLRSRCVKSVDDDGRRQRTAEAYLSYKLTKCAFGSGELKTRPKMTIEPRHEKTCFDYMRTTKVQISLRIRTV